MNAFNFLVLEIVPKFKCRMNKTVKLRQPSVAPHFDLWWS